MSSVIEQFGKFCQEVEVRGGDYKKACLALYAQLGDIQRGVNQPVSLYLDAVLGPIKTKVSIPDANVSKDGKVEYKLQMLLDHPTHSATISLTAATVKELDSMLNGNHPMFGTLEDGKPFDFSTGKQLFRFSVPFRDGAVFCFEVAKADNYVGVEYYLTRNGDMLNTTGIPMKRSSIIGTYGLFSNDKVDPKAEPTHYVFINQE